MLMRQAHMTAHDYMMHVINDIDELLGDGYAKQHPELIAAYMQTAALDLVAAIIAKETSAGLEKIACAILEIWRVQWEQRDRPGHPKYCRYARPQRSH